ncbi:MAG: hypothetical protein GY705_31075, partial [Bacteroidetes bacterium]|nr:hypothetical protein [Bacteroidota bacterium]
MIVIAAVVIAAGVFIVLKMTSKPADPAEQTETAASAPEKASPENEFEKIMEALLKLNLLIRTDAKL